MSFESLPEKARNSALIQTLDGKLQGTPKADFDYRGELVRLAKQVTADVRHINQLFPEYTPHDSNYHLDRLFHVADLVVEKRRFDTCNAAELFVLAAALYAHDWGMAVSENEREAVRGLLKGTNPPSNFSILPDEADRLSAFAASRGLDADVAVRDLSYWREYVRETHPDRSAARSRQFFRNAGGGIGDAIARVARGHGIDIAELDKANEYPTDFSVHGLNTNLRALAVYVRLIDLLDIADDRTPYAIWEFVSPRDARSAMEWQKHRSLNPVTCPSYQSGRMILIDGNTDDPDVWAALRDLERYVKDQVRSCNDVLARLSDANFHLDLAIVEWRIATPGFTPIDLRFEFHRESMFHILGDEIYEGDVYVFLRELLQNSIDAIRLRSELLARQDMTTAGLIRFEVEHGDNGSVTVSCRDNGIGMDEYIIRNYLALAGRSYYSSQEFKHLGLEMDAIARFGIGILSCFIASESIEIESLRDPMIAHSRQPLRIVIPAVERQFRVYPGGSHIKTGTCVTVHVSGERLKAAPAGWNARLRVADYLAEVGSFSEIPILVSEKDSETLILRPDADEKEAKRLAAIWLGKAPTEVTFAVRSAAQDFPWDGVFLPQDENKAQSNLRVKWFDLQQDLGLTALEGRAASLLPKDEMSFAQSGHFHISGKTPLKQTSFGIDPDNQSDGIRWFDSKSARLRESLPKPHSIAADVIERTYCNGIMVVGDPGSMSPNNSQIVPGPALWVNIPRAHALQLNVARQEVRGKAPAWRQMVSEALYKHVLAKELDMLLSVTPKDRLRRLGQLMCWYGLPAEVAITALGAEKRPVVWLNPDRTLEFGDDNALSGLCAIQPGILDPLASRSLLSTLYGGPCEETEASSFWRGERVFLFADWGSTSDYVTAALEFATAVYELAYPIRRIRFLRGPRDQKDIIAQHVLQKGALATEVTVAALRRRAIFEPQTLSPEEWCRIGASLERGDPLYSRMTARLGWFLPPHENFFACGSISWNTAHPVIQVLLQWSLSLTEAERTNSLPKSKLGELRDAYNKFIRNLVGSTEYSRSEWGKTFRKAHEFLLDAGLVISADLPDPPKAQDFVIGSLMGDNQKGVLLGPNYDEYLERASVPYGTLIA